MKLADRQTELVAQMRELVDEYFAGRPSEDPTHCPLSVPLYGAEEVMTALETLLSQNVTMGARVREFEAGLLDYLRSTKSELLARIASEKALSDELIAALKTAVTDFKAGTEFTSTTATATAAD